jgi:hypothetical protein
MPRSKVGTVGGDTGGRTGVGERAGDEGPGAGVERQAAITNPLPILHDSVRRHQTRDAGDNARRFRMCEVYVVGLVRR